MNKPKFPQSTKELTLERIKDTQALLDLSNTKLKAKLIAEKTLVWNGSKYLWVSTVLRQYSNNELPQQFDNLRTYWHIKILQLTKTLENIPND